MKKEDIDKSYSRLLNEMLLDKTFNYAGDTLKGLKAYYDKHNTFTEKQKRAIENIYAKARI